MKFEELQFSWQVLQWAVLSAIGIYSWIVGRQSASNKEMLELRTRLVSIEAQLAHVPTQQQVTILLEKLSGTEAGLRSIDTLISGMSSRLEYINNYLLNNK
ncbi:DUF2730 domain-containing protein [Serratia marcescens]|uniref:DUF2730 domain-containing protein n=1 Tax=Serratia marcescens TaxID=615 RepID=UPI0027E58A66|nr:DUF2730 domain-containing protein [Serratia marcescens]HCL5501390.1 DUF2730 domain-containing protein [Klebsiella pneumoniae]EJC0203866.1 DUF2730 domain-containing protein [Serratia marcescens]WLS21832.1 DUF2730 domain-containing protein [Serratia marcescens]HCB1481493.1 DUF2730 domain-containing protein [Serratia marcescens]HCB1611186.1 DUF2730 domain-containing protein [Serratia marcescens]